MAGNVFIANIGSRDITFDVDDDGELFCVVDKGQGAKDAAKELGCEEGIRSIATHLLKELGGNDHFARRLRFPVLTPAIEFALSEVHQIDEVLLLGTDQPTGVPDHHRMWDTIDSATVIGECLKRRYGEMLRSIEAVSVDCADPHRYDAAYEFISRILHQRVANDDKVFAALRGGLPSLNSSLRALLVDRYGRDVTLIEVDEPDVDSRILGVPGAARKVDPWPFRRTAFVRSMRVLLRRCDYAGMLGMLESEGLAAPDGFGYLDELLGHAVARFNMDFGAALGHLRPIGPVQYPNLSPSELDAIAELRTGCMEHRSVSRLVDVSTSARPALSRGDFMGFLARVATFSETTRRYLASLLSGIALDSEWIRYDEVKRANPGLYDDLDTRISPKRKLDRSRRSGWRVSRIFLKTITSWGVDHLPREKKTALTPVNKIRIELGSLKKLETLRNRSLHNLQGISRQELDGAARGDIENYFETATVIIDEMISLHGILEGKRPPHAQNAYELIDQLLHSELSRLETDPSFVP